MPHEDASKTQSKIGENLLAGSVFPEDDALEYPAVAMLLGFQMRTSLIENDVQSAALVLDAFFGVQDLNIPRKFLWITIKRYDVQVGLCGGELHCRMENCSVVSRFPNSSIDFKVAEVVTRTHANSKTVGDEGGAGFEVSLEKGIGFKGEGKDYSSATNSSGSSVETPITRTLIDIGGPDQQPFWIFRPALPDALLSGQLPGSLPNPLASLKIAQAPYKVSSIFCIRPQNIKIVDTYNGTSGRRKAKVAVVRRALEKRLFERLPHKGNRLLIASSIAHGPRKPVGTEGETPSGQEPAENQA